jgi:hypothetical protein
VEKSSITVPLPEPINTRYLTSHYLFPIKQLTQLAFDLLLLGDDSRKEESTVGSLGIFAELSD